MQKEKVPTYDQLINPTLKALHELGGSASIYELVDEIISNMGISEEIAGILHGKGSQTEIEYRAAWARNYLKNAGLIENTERSIWVLTQKGRKTNQVDTKKLIRDVQKQFKERREQQEISKIEPGEEHAENRTWKEELIEVLLSVEPDVFERLCQRLLREAGFIEVEVTGKSGDGGIDGHGTIRIGGFVSFNVLFQSKRYSGNIGPEVVRGFRGAMTGRADKGLIITTGGFTREARKEATRDGAPPIDLIDGELLIEKLKEFKLGVKTRMVEEVEIDREWFSSL